MNNRPVKAAAAPPDAEKKFDQRSIVRLPIPVYIGNAAGQNARHRSRVMIGGGSSLRRTRNGGKPRFNQIDLVASPK
jgi:hypothetical protein